MNVLRLSSENKKAAGYLPTQPKRNQKSKPKNTDMSRQMEKNYIFSFDACGVSN